MQKEYDLKIAENKTQKRDDITNNAAASFIHSFMENPQEGMQNFNALVKLKNVIDSTK